MDNITQTLEKEETLSSCIQNNLSTTTYCIVDISSAVITSLTDLLADYYDCWYEFDNGSRENDIEYWLYNDEKKIYITEKDGTEKIIDISTIKKLWTYLEESKKLKNAH